MALSISFSVKKSTNIKRKKKKKTSLNFPNTRNGAWLSHEDTSSHLNGTKSNSASQKQPCVLWSQAAYAENDNSKFPPKFQEVVGVEAATSCVPVAQNLGRATGLEQKSSASMAVQATSQGKWQKNGLKF